MLVSCGLPNPKNFKKKDLTIKTFFKGSIATLRNIEHSESVFNFHIKQTLFSWMKQALDLESTEPIVL